MPKGLSAIQPQARIPELDGLRGVAILLVVLCHYSTLQSLPQSFVVKFLARLVGAGWLGVDIFFVLSGFLITRILLSDDSNWRNFYRNRAFRILPAFLVVLVLTLSFLDYRSWLFIVLTLLFLGNFRAWNVPVVDPLIQLWSLAVEEQFYLFWPQVAWRVSKPVLLKIALALGVLSMLFRFAAYEVGFSMTVIYLSTPTHLDGIALGCAVAVATQLPAAREWLCRRWKGIAWAALALFVAGAMMLRLLLNADDIRVLLFAIPAVSALTAALVFAASEQQLPSALSATLRNRALVYLGMRSYALYLIHVPVLCGIDSLIGESRWNLIRMHGLRASVVAHPFGIALSILLAEVSWRLIEQPAQRLKRRWFQLKAEPQPANP